MGEIVGAMIAVLLLSLLFRKILLKVTKLQQRLATTIASASAILFCTVASLQPMGQSALILYPVGGAIVWLWLFFDLPIYKKKKKVEPNASG
jgi:glycerol uptake facilitator-like aquaporin